VTEKEIDRIEASIEMPRRGIRMFYLRAESIHYLSRGSAHRYPLDKRREARQACRHAEGKKNCGQTSCDSSCGSGRVIGPWPVGLRMLIFPLGDNWCATFSLKPSGVADYRDDVLQIVLRLRDEFDIIEL
jgi:hypothetical protein